ncbi:MAG: SMP-30/gluconolactonase/LRE family protein [Planctomycetota bacterium]|nr:SMP-30/gluconolactonase/LRE family protein [Planctomycetota bacterium]
MNPHALLTGLLLLATTSITTAQDDRFRALVPAEAKLEKLGTGMKFVEGPVWSDENGGFLIFSDIPANELKKWTKAEGVSTWAKESNQTNGNTRDREGRLISCEHAGRRVTLVHKSDKREALIDSFDGKKLNSPNDAVVTSDGTIWFTDPTYGLGRNPKEQTANHVFAFNPQTKEINPVVSDFVQPNGLCFSPDEKKLYVADSGKPRHIRVFDVRPDNTLSEGKVFCTIDKGVPDGIRCDEKGNVWSSTGDGVQVFAPDGKLLGRIPVPESPANLCFGGADGKTLFITARTSLYAIETTVRGAQRP